MNTNSGGHQAPAVNKTAFNCPHCGAFAKQHWFSVYADPMRKDHTPPIIKETDLPTLNYSGFETAGEKERMRKLFERVATGVPLLDRDSHHADFHVYNLFASSCFNCNELAVWLQDKLIWPPLITVAPPNADLPEFIRSDYVEAAEIVRQSPRGAAALLRLAIQKICKELGEPGRNINDDIASLVRKGLDSRVQQALDIVRVVGNNAVHPGNLDIQDDAETAERLFSLVNMIADIMISQPKSLDIMFNSLPEPARKAIAKRDATET